MRASNAGVRVHVQLNPSHHPDDMLEATQEWLDAEEDRKRWSSFPVTEVPYPTLERFDAADANYEAMFAEYLTIDAAEELLGQLKRAVYKAKVNAGVFNRELS